MTTAGKLVLIHNDTEHDRIVSIDESIVSLQRLGLMTRQSFDIGVRTGKFKPSNMKPFTATYRFRDDDTTYDVTFLADNIDAAQTKATADDVCDHSVEDMISIECDW